jgi:broad specificity phosphatase PhoE
MKRFCLVRHGQTDWNLEGRLQGQSDVPLNQTGRAEARSLTRQLSDIIAGVLELPVTTEPRLREINQGEWEGQFAEDIKARHDEHWEQRNVDPIHFRPPGGESVAEVADRTQDVMSYIAHQHPFGSILVVSHGLALATIICREKGISLGKAFNNIPNNAFPVWVDWKE